MSRRVARRTVRGTVCGIALATTVGMAACGSPEAERVRGGDLGADPGNRDEVVEMHRGAAMYADTPCLTSLPDCDGPEPVSGRTTGAGNR